MRAALVITALAFAGLAGTVQAQSNAVLFSEPAYLGGEVTSTPAWLLIVFDDDSSGKGKLTLPEGAPFVNHTLHETAELRVGLVDRPGRPQTTDMEGLLPSGAKLDIEPSAIGPAGLFVRATALVLTAKVPVASIQGIDSTECLGGFFSIEEQNRKVIRPNVRCFGEAAAGIVAEGPGGLTQFSVRAEGVQALEWHNFEIECLQPGDCPSGGARTSQTTEYWDASVTNRQYGYDLVQAPTGTLEFDGVAQIVAFGAPQLDFTLAGWLRLPGATDCAACSDAGNGTLWVEGNLDFSNVQYQNDRLAGGLDGDVSALRVDEQPIDPAMLTGFQAGATVAVVGGVLGIALKWILPALFSRVAPDRALDNPRRRQIHDYVGSNPGSSFRAVVRGTGIPASTTRHHLTSLVNSNHLVERRFGNTVRLFHNHGKYDGNWQQVAGLREPTQVQLYEWLRLNPGKNQKDVLTAMNNIHGWHPATTQHRLGRLVRSGVLEVKSHGRFRKYYIAPAAANIVLNHAPAAAS